MSLILKELPVISSIDLIVVLIIGILGVVSTEVVLVVVEVVSVVLNVIFSVITTEVVGVVFEIVVSWLFSKSSSVVELEVVSVGFLKGMFISFFNNMRSFSGFQLLRQTVFFPSEMPLQPGTSCFCLFDF